MGKNTFLTTESIKKKQYRKKRSGTDGKAPKQNPAFYAECKIGYPNRNARQNKETAKRLGNTPKRRGRHGQKNRKESFKEKQKERKTNKKRSR